MKVTKLKRGFRINCTDREFELLDAVMNEGFMWFSRECYESLEEMKKNWGESAYFAWLRLGMPESWSDMSEFENRR